MITTRPTPSSPSPRSFHRPSHTHDDVVVVLPGRVSRLPPRYHPMQCIIIVCSISCHVRHGPEGVRERMRIASRRATGRGRDLVHDIAAVIGIGSMTGPRRVEMK
jgi:hypothetical protein